MHFFSVDHKNSIRGRGLAWLGRKPSKLAIPGSNPGGRTIGEPYSSYASLILNGLNQGFFADLADVQSFFSSVFPHL